ncbi:phage baseplate protein [Sphingobium sp. WCS2017Hpa-17]|uniref:phage baseplate protein n=1 Tax=Sphingobium sp. WCS2017Hpa-17 TaxID=3073638 RepID=UPI00288C508A|nr:hypothetical protein [Sphingobium sp. WCS2017Hpa-17]
MAGPRFPNVPIATGVPAVMRSAATQVIAGVGLLSTDSSDVSQLAASQWGVFKADGGRALWPDNVVALNYRAEHRIADYPIERGGFESYDKVALPFDATVRMTKGGTIAARVSFLRAIEAIRGDRKLYNVTTPEQTYRNVNVAEVQVDRSQESGAGLIIVDIHLREIRQNAKAEFSKSKDPAGVSPYNNGSAQPADPPANAGSVQ